MMIIIIIIIIIMLIIIIIIIIIIMYPCNRPYSYSHGWTGTSMRCRLMQGK